MSLSSRWAALASGESDGLAGVLHRAALSPFSLGYSLGVSGYRALYRRGILKTEGVPCKVVSVGNLTVGGTGKTPFVVGLSREFTGLGIKHCVICYGYGAQSREPVALASDGKGYTADWRVVGDEAAMLAQKLDQVPVLTARRRILAARRAVRDFGPAVIVLDDGFQYWRLERDLDVVLLDSSHPFGNGWLFPAGTLRERKTALRRAGTVVLGQGSAESRPGSPGARELVEKLAPGAAIIESSVEPVGLQDAAKGSELGLGWIKEKRVGVVSGIANPHSFEQTVRSLGAKVAFAVRFADHHPYSVFDIKRILGYCSERGVQAVVVTAKDSVKLRGLLGRMRIPAGLTFAVLEIEARIREPGSFRAIADTVMGA